MFSSIKTSKVNRDLVTKLTNKLNLGAENVIARIAFAYSLSQKKTMDLTQIQDSSGKEYNVKVLFGDYAEIYIALICVHYNIYKSDKDIARYIKMHIDDGLQGIYDEIETKNSISGNDFIINQVELGLAHLGV
ncbi:DndE family protein [Pedobacter deserti]|uniref:DndE family protein n=1 Tax=Pedobacter deserti TaxID=2817382 RepID=UPI002108A697|nr:DndE family protein [Pedobacter sp. SYSU D00382]